MDLRSGRGRVIAGKMCAILAIGFGLYSYIIAYQFDDSTLTIARIVHGTRNFRRLFKR